MTDRRARGIALLCLASPALVIVVLSLDARARRAASRAHEPALATVALRLPTSDLALSGGAMAPPIDVWTAAAQRSKRPAAGGSR